MTNTPSPLLPRVTITLGEDDDNDEEEGAIADGEHGEEAADGT